MKRITFIILFIFFKIFCYSQIQDTISINNKDYIVTIDTTTHKIHDVEIMKEEKFYEKIYLGMDLQKDNIEQKILYDITDYSKISLGYDLGRERITLGVYISLGKLHRRKYNLTTIYF